MQNISFGGIATRGPSRYTSGRIKAYGISRALVLVLCSCTFSSMICLNDISCHVFFHKQSIKFHTLFEIAFKGWPFSEK